MLAVTGRFADGWYPTQKMTPAEYAEKLGRIRAAGQAAGRDMSAFEPALQVQLALGKSRKAVLEGVLKLPAAAALAMLIPGAVWTKHGLRHPLGDDFEGFAQFVPEEITPAQLEASRRQVTPELLGEAAVAGSVEEVTAEIRPLVAAGLRHLVLWNIGPLASGGRPDEFVRLAVLIRRLRRLSVG
jgi:phthiodiolone/phenolphthiodiolone dimycocerosates ketoreductase